MIDEETLSWVLVDVSFLLYIWKNGLMVSSFLSDTLIRNVSRETFLKPKKKTQDNVSRETF